MLITRHIGRFHLCIGSFNWTNKLLIWTWYMRTGWLAFQFVVHLLASHLTVYSCNLLPSDMLLYTLIETTVLVFGIEVSQVDRFTKAIVEAWLCKSRCNTHYKQRIRDSQRMTATAVRVPPVYVSIYMLFTSRELSKSMECQNNIKQPNYLWILEKKKTHLNFKPFPSYIMIPKYLKAASKLNQRTAPAKRSPKPAAVWVAFRFGQHVT